MKKILSAMLAMAMMFSLAACGKKDQPAGSQSGTQSGSQSASASQSTAEELTYAVEAGSAGEEVANENGFKTVSVETQAMALMEVDSGTADAAIIDLLMAGAMVGEGTSYPDIKVTDQKLNSEEYGVGCRKGSDLAAYINAVMAEAYADGAMEELAKTYGVQEAILEQPESAYPQADAAGDVAYIQGKGKLIVGITDFEPMDYKAADGSWIGFDADMAKLVAEKLGVDIEFFEIDWDRKVDELDGKGIDVVWNGMTLTEGVKAAMECTNAYCENAQVVVTK